MGRIRFERPCVGRESDYFIDIMDVVIETDKENWSFFGSAEKRSFALEMLDFGDLTRVIYCEEQAIGYVDIRLLKPNAPILLCNDNYKKMGLSLNDLLIKYSGNNRCYRECHLYVNVIAIKKEFQGKVSIVKCVAEAIKDIFICNFSYGNGYHVQYHPNLTFGVGVTEQGKKMCKLIGLSFVSKSQREYGDILNDRYLYQGHTDEMISRLEKVTAFRK